MISAAIVRELIAAGVTGDALVAALERIEAAYMPDRSSNAIRQARYRERGGGKIPIELRDAVMEADNFRCNDCGTEDNLCIDHIVPVSKGGTTEFDNLQVLCIPCNSKKKDRIRKAQSRSHLSKMSQEVTGNPRTSEPKESFPHTPFKETPTLKEKGPLKGSQKESSPPPSKPNGQLSEIASAVDAWNSLADDLRLAKCQKLTARRKSALAARLKDAGGVEGFTAIIGKIRGSPFLRGENERGWRADFDFVLQEKSFTKLAEGAYPNGTNLQQPKPSRADFFAELHSRLDERIEAERLAGTGGSNNAASDPEGPAKH